MAAAARTGPSQSLVAGAPIKCPTWVAENQVLGPLSAAFLEALPGTGLEVKELGLHLPLWWWDVGVSSSNSPCHIPAARLFFFEVSYSMSKSDKKSTKSKYRLFSFIIDTKNLNRVLWNWIEQLIKRVMMNPSRICFNLEKQCSY